MSDELYDIKNKNCSIFPATALALFSFASRFLFGPKYLYKKIILLGLYVEKSKFWYFPS